MLAAIEYVLLHFSIYLQLFNAILQKFELNKKGYCSHQYTTWLKRAHSKPGASFSSSNKEVGPPSLAKLLKLQYQPVW